MQETAKSSGISKVVLWLLFGIFTTLLAGYYFHSSPEPVYMGKYSASYLYVLVCITVFGVFCLWYAWRVRQTPGPTLKYIIYMLVILAILIALLLPWGAWKYYVRGERHRLKEPFHPFLQGDYNPINQAVAKEKPPGVLRIVCLGASTTADNWKVKPPHWGYPWFLEKELKKVFARDDIEVINFGTPMYSSEHSLILWLTAARDYNPDIVIIMSAINDLIRSFEHPSLSTGSFREDYGNYYGVASNWASPREPYLKKLIGNSFFEVWYSDFREAKDHVTEKPFNNFRSLPVFKRNMRLLTENIRLDGAKPILLTQPFLYHESMTSQELAMLKFPAIFCIEHGLKADVPSMHTGMKSFNEVVRHIAHEMDVLYIDLETIIPKDREYFIDDVHYTKKGKKQVARNIALRLKEVGFD